MNITNELKKAFTSMDHNEHNYRGIGFKKEVMPEEVYVKREEMEQERMAEQIK